MMKRMIALMLALVLCFTLFAGCSKDKADEPATPAVIDYNAAFAKFDPDTVVMTVDGVDVTWSEFYYMLYSSLSQIEYYMGDIYWDEFVSGTEITFDQYTMDMTTTMIKQLHAIDKKAAELNLTLTAEDMALIDETIAGIKEQNFGENATDEDFNAFLLENVFLTADAYRYINENSLKYDKVFVETIGAEGEKITDEEVENYIASVPYITVKHILLMVVDEDTGAALSDEEIAKAKETAEQLLAQLQAIKDPKKLASTFDQLMNEYSQDTGLLFFPGGYTFTKGEMYAEFEEAAFALEEYELSDIVTSQAGYHILLRLPTERNSIVDFDYQTYENYTVLAYAATDIYSQKLTEWMSGCDLKWTKEFENITVKQIFE